MSCNHFWINVLVSVLIIKRKIQFWLNYAREHKGWRAGGLVNARAGGGLNLPVGHGCQRATRREAVRAKVGRPIKLRSTAPPRRLPRARLEQGRAPRAPMAPRKKRCSPRVLRSSRKKMKGTGGGGGSRATHFCSQGRKWCNVGEVVLNFLWLGFWPLPSYWIALSSPHWARRLPHSLAIFWCS